MGKVEVKTEGGKGERRVAALKESEEVGVEGEDEGGVRGDEGGQSLHVKSWLVSQCCDGGEDARDTGKHQKRGKHHLSKLCVLS